MFEQLVEYYSNLLIIQYNNQPKAKATIEAFVRVLLANNLTMSVRDGFNLDTAVDGQLDIIAQYVGVNRTFRGQDFTSVDYFAFTDYTESVIPSNKKGFSTYSTTQDGEVLNYDKIISQTQMLGDDDFRTLIKLKIVQNNSNHSIQSIDQSLEQFFGSDIRVDDIGDMRLIYFIPSNLTDLIRVAIDKGVLIKPMGVGIQYLIREESPIFGFANYSNLDNISPFVEGFTNYLDFDTKAGNVLTYNKLLES